MSLPPAISTRGISKRFGRLVAVRDLSLEVNQGEIFGFLGLNGAGKTTTIRLLLDLLRPTAGRAAVLGFDCQSQGLQVRARVGYMPGEIGLYGDMTGVQLLDFLARLGNQTVQPDYREQLQHRLNMPDGDLRRKVREYSSGMKRKLGLIQAFQADPPVLILDEPTESLDPVMQESLYKLLFEACERGRTVFLSSHVLSEVERVCTRIGIIRRGSMVLVSEVDEIRRMTPRKVRIRFASEVPSRPSPLPAGHQVLEIRPTRWDIAVHGELGPLVRLLSGLPVQDVEVTEPRLEEILMKYFEEDFQ